jgi:hypothetical protein
MTCNSTQSSRSSQPRFARWQCGMCCTRDESILTRYWSAANVLPSLRATLLLRSNYGARFADVPCFVVFRGPEAVDAGWQGHDLFGMITGRSSLMHMQSRCTVTSFFPARVPIPFARGRRRFHRDVPPQPTVARLAVCKSRLQLHLWLRIARGCNHRRRLLCTFGSVRRVGEGEQRWTAVCWTGTEAHSDALTLTSVRRRSSPGSRRSCVRELMAIQN